MLLYDTALFFIITGILVIVFAMPFGVYPCTFKNPRGWVFGKGLLVTILSYVLIIIGIIVWVTGMFS